MTPKVFPVLKTCIWAWLAGERAAEVRGVYVQDNKLVPREKAQEWLIKQTSVWKRK